MGLNESMVDQVPERYYALSVKQPWAYLVTTGQKTIELRTWATNFRGLLVIHASRTIDEPALRYFDLQDSALTTGHLIGAVMLLDVREMSADDLRQNRWNHRVVGPFNSSLFGFFLRAEYVFSEPVPIRGQISIFQIEDSQAVQSIYQQIKNWRTGVG